MCKIGKQHDCYSPFIRRSSSFTTGHVKQQILSRRYSLISVVTTDMIRSGQDVIRHGQDVIRHVRAYHMLNRAVDCQSPGHVGTSPGSTRGALHVAQNSRMNSVVGQ
jgi:hypothetical protein